MQTVANAQDGPPDSECCFCFSMDAGQRTSQSGVLVASLSTVTGRKFKNQSLDAATPVLLYTHSKAENREVLKWHGGDAFDQVGSLQYVIDRMGNRRRVRVVECHDLKMYYALCGDCNVGSDRNCPFCNTCGQKGMSQFHTEYTTSRGESLNSVAEKFSMRLTYLQQLNSGLADFDPSEKLKPKTALKVTLSRFFLIDLSILFLS